MGNSNSMRDHTYVDSHGNTVEVKYSDSPGYLGRLGNSFQGACFGFVLILIAVPLVFLNEGVAVKTHRSLNEALSQVVSLPSPLKLDSAYHDKLVHVTGNLEPEGVLKDWTFEVESRGLRLERTVEILQWKEQQRTETKQVNGKEERRTTYSYHKEWVSEPINSWHFKTPQGHENHGTMPFSSEKQVASRVWVGPFTLSSGLVDQVTNRREVAMSGQVGAQIQGLEVVRMGGHEAILRPMVNGQVQPGGHEEVGDIRVRFTEVPAGEVSIVAMQHNDKLRAWPSSIKGYNVELLSRGDLLASEVLEHAQDSNAMWTWIKRALGFLAVWLGFSLLLGPFSTMVDFVPLVRGLVRFGFETIGFFAALILFTVTMAVAWFFYRPMLSAALIATALAGVFAMRHLCGDKGKMA